MEQLTESAVYVKLQAAVADAGGQRAWANMHDISATYLNDVINGRSSPGAKILTALGLRKHVRYVPLTGDANGPDAP